MDSGTTSLRLPTAVLGDISDGDTFLGVVYASAAVGALTSAELALLPDWLEGATTVDLATCAAFAHALPLVTLRLGASSASSVSDDAVTSDDDAIRAAALDFVVNGSQLIFVGEGSSTCAFAVTSTTGSAVVGNVAMGGRLVVFDHGNERVGFSAGVNCEGVGLSVESFVSLPAPTETGSKKGKGYDGMSTLVIVLISVGGIVGICIGLAAFFVLAPWMAMRKERAARKERKEQRREIRQADVDEAPIRTESFMDLTAAMRESWFRNSSASSAGGIGAIGGATTAPSPPPKPTRGPLGGSGIASSCCSVAAPPATASDLEGHVEMHCSAPPKPPSPVPSAKPPPPTPVPQQGEAVAIPLPKHPPPIPPHPHEPQETGAGEAVVTPPPKPSPPVPPVKPPPPTPVPQQGKAEATPPPKPPPPPQPAAPQETGAGEAVVTPLP